MQYARPIDKKTHITSSLLTLKRQNIPNLVSIRLLRMTKPVSFMIYTFQRTRMSIC